jgi:regulator of nucleoside diphosphate kinase
MANHHELLLSTHDAAALHALVGEWRPAQHLEADAVEALTDLLEEARLLPHESIPDDRITMNSRVTYVQEPGGPQRTVKLAHPVQADVAAGRISVLSPVGRALLGRAPGAVIAVPGRAQIRIRILSVERSAPC